MFAPLEKVKIPSSYGGDLPERMAKCAPDMLGALTKIANDLAATKTRLVLSDLYRSYDMQLQAHLDYVTKKKKAYSPAPGGSMHEAGRAFDMELNELKKIDLGDFWEIAAKYGVVPIIDTPSSGKSEAWHFDCRGSHDLVHRYYAAGKGSNFTAPYRAMAASAIVSTGQKVDELGDDPLSGYVQSALIRLGQDIGNMDGRIGPKSRAGLAALGIDPNADLATVAAIVDRRLQEQFPSEYFVQGAFPIVTSEVSAPFLMVAAAPHPASYTPPPKAKSLLGKIVDALASATSIDESFALQPKIVAELPGGQLYFDSALQLDTDGWPDGKGKGDASWQPQTSLRYANGRSIDADRVPYMVLPGGMKWVQKLGISLGDYATVIYAGKVVHAVFADSGPSNKLGEGSLRLLRELGAERLKPNGRILNADAGPGIVTIVYPNSGDRADRADEATLLAAVRTKGAALFAALAG